MDNLNKALYNLFQEMSETATDMYWSVDGECQFSNEELDLFTAADYNAACHRACLEMIERVRYGNDFPYLHPEEREDTSIPFDKCYGALGDLFGKHLRLILLEHTMKKEEDKMKTSLNFKEYILSYDKDNTAFGDVAKDIKADKEFPKGAKTYRSIRKYLVSQNACTECLQVLETMYKAYLESEKKNEND